MGAEQNRKPNIVVIMADDMGFSDLGCYGSEIQTPHLDQLAENGLRCSQMYNSARCCPSRAALLTGLHPHQAGIGHMVDDSGVGPAYQGFLRSDCMTMAEVLRGAGYRTLMSGKWHVGGPYQANRPETWRPGDERHPLPLQRGFQKYYGMLGGGGSYFNPPYMMEDDRLIDEGGPGYYLTDAISERAVEMLQSVRDDEPFFLYVSYTAPHWPLHALPEDIQRYAGLYEEGGWDEVRRNRYRRLKELGLVENHWDLSPRDPDAPPWQDVVHKQWEDKRMAVYAAQVDRMDQGIGRIVAELEQSGQINDTLIMFLSDNGGCAEFLAEDSRSPQPFRYNIPTYDGRPMKVGNTPVVDPGPDDTFMSYDLPWANASNTPFRLFKHWVHEGGIATPFICHWPRQIEAGRVEHAPMQIMDIMATCLDAAGAEYPEESNGHRIPPLEGESFLPLLGGDHCWQRQRPLFWEHEGNKAVRTGRWKLVCRYPNDWELYDIQQDRTELHDLSAQYPEIKKDLMERYRRWAERCGVLPWPLK